MLPGYKHKQLARLGQVNARQLSLVSRDLLYSLVVCWMSPEYHVKEAAALEVCQSLPCRFSA